jgi:hypothetical protein
MTINGENYTRRKIAELLGVVVFEITAKSGQIPNAKNREDIYREIAQFHLENLLIFIDDNRTQSVWYWVKREGTKIYPRDHVYTKMAPCDLLLSKISALKVDMEELETISTIDVAKRLQRGLDVERVTKKFFEEFKLQHTALLDAKSGIQGISNEADRRWYASVLLNRLIFVYFLQMKGFIDKGKTLYLQDKLKESQERGQDLFYSEFLPALFFEGFGKPENQRSDAAKRLIGDVKYLNGGLFLKHQIEQNYPNITIPDAAFENIFDLFTRYSWSLDDTVGGNENEINPAVLGYIFEKYINQKAFGAYYTRPEITKYLCDRTINKLILDRVNERPNPPTPFPAREGGEKLPSPIRGGVGGEVKKFESIIDAPMSGDAEIVALIAQGESAELDFKASAWWDIPRNKKEKFNKRISDTVAAFLNVEKGGTLLIGVDDDGAVVGIEYDYNKKFDTRKNRDVYENNLMTALLNACGKDCGTCIQISFGEVEGKDVCKIAVSFSSRPVYIKDGQEECFYIRAGNSNRALSVREATDYIKNHWG